MTDLHPDPSRGFVALPLELLDTPMSPGAFRALCEFCRMADPEGYCWPSLEQLGRRLGRSRAAVSGYVKELRTLSLLATETQRMANGYNYRLKYRVTFWKAWRAAFRRPSKATASETERSVKPAERPKGKNQIHTNQCPAPGGGTALKKLHDEWAGHAGRAPFPGFQSDPDHALIARTREALETPAPAAEPGNLHAVLEQFLHENGVASEPDWLASILPDLRASNLGETGFRLALERRWRPHWSRLPAPAFVRKLLSEAAPSHPDGALRKLLKGYLRRWDRVQGLYSSA